MTSRPRDLNTPNFSGQWCQPDGSLTPLALTVIRRLWERTGNGPGTDGAWLEHEADQALFNAHKALTEAAQARRDAQEVLNTAIALLQQATSLQGQIRKLLEMMQEEAIIRATDRRLP